MHTAHVDLVSHWHIPAPVEQVWAALSDPRGWVEWWPQVRSVRLMAPGDAQGHGRVHAIRWSAGLPHELALDWDAIEILPPERLRSRSAGAVNGEGIWLLRADGARTDVTSVWRVEPRHPATRWLLPLLAPWWRGLHARVMRDGEAGLTRRLRSRP